MPRSISFHPLRYLIWAGVVSLAVIVVGFPEPVAAQELPPIGETSMTHNHELVGIIDGCRVWKIDFWGKFIFVARCPEGLGETKWNDTKLVGKTTIVTEEGVVGK